MRGSFPRGKQLEHHAIPFLAQVKDVQSFTSSSSKCHYGVMVRDKDSV
jgi:hypothetical protein